MLCCLSWLCSTWNSIRNWIGDNKFLTVVHVVAVVLLVFGVVMVCQHWEWIVTESGSTIIRNLGLVIGGLIAIGFGIWRGVVASRQAKTSQRGLLNERYQKGTEMLGSEVLSVRLGGIYALQRLAEDDPVQYHVQIMRLLCAFVRNPTKDKDRDDHARPAVNEERAQRTIKAQVKALMVPEDVQAALEAVGTRSDADVKLEKKEKFDPDLSGAQLSGVDLSKRKANLSGVDLSDAVFAPADLKRLDLNAWQFVYEVPSTKAILPNVNLSGANLVRADLTEANLTHARLSKATGLIQGQLNDSVADPAPKLDGLCDAETGDLLEWRGGEPDRQ